MYRKEDEHKRLSRSKRLRKYESVYKSYIRKSEQSNMNKSPRRSRNKKEIKRHNQSYKKSDNHKVCNTNKPIKRKTLNNYQKFVQKESKKEKYKDIPGKERLAIIAAKWKKINRNK